MSRRIQPGTLRFVFIAIVLMLLADQFVFGGKRSYIEDAKTAKVVERQEESLASAERGPPVVVKPPEGEFFEMVPPLEPEPEPPKIAEQPKTPEPLPQVIKPNVKGAKIAIIIDDLGMDVKHSKQVIDLPAPVTLAFLPYAPRTRELAEAGKAKGHTLIVHVPMEAMDGDLNIGPGGLKAAMAPPEFQAAFGKMMGSFDGYVGINNHMGSRLTQDKEAMARLMNILATKNLFFVDSKTIQSSVAAQEAAKAGVKYAERDIFLDHVETRAFVDKALAQAERTAARKGYAIAIGHPKSFTIEGLKAWIPTLAAKGIELVPVTELLLTPKKVIEVKEDIVPVVVPEAAPVQLPTVVPQAAPDVVAPTPQESETPLAPSLDMFPEAGSNAPSGIESAAPVQSHLPPPTQSPVP